MKAKENKKKNISKDSLGNRMKNYESINRTFLIPKMHTVLRLDGRAFHTYTKPFEKPFDDFLISTMDETAKYLCSKIQGAKFAYVQSDEITIYLSDNDEMETRMWYGGNIQKMVSVSASIATTKFNHLMFLRKFKSIIKSERKITRDGCMNYNDTYHTCKNTDFEKELENITLAEFDSRVFQLPNAEETVNCVLWRQQDCTRNSIQSVAQSLYSQKELHGKNTSMLQEMIFQKGINWNDYDAKLKRGRFIQNVTYVNGQPIIPSVYYSCVDVDNQLIAEGKAPVYGTTNDKVRTKWESTELPIITQDREFLLSRIK